MAYHRYAVNGMPVECELLRLPERPLQRRNIHRQSDRASCARAIASRQVPTRLILVTREVQEMRPTRPQLVLEVLEQIILICQSSSPDLVAQLIALLISTPSLNCQIWYFDLAWRSISAQI